MDIHTATEEAYKKGYENGKRDGVVHGRWIDRYGMKYDNHLYECSVCKNPALYMPITDSLGSDHIYQATTLYCPYCGAKMDLEV